MRRVADKPVAFLRLLRRYWKRTTAVTIVIAHILGAWSSIEAIMESRTSQGAIAWAISLNTFPYLAVPAYWIFGHSKFSDYKLARQTTSEEVEPLFRNLRQTLQEQNLTASMEDARMAELSALTGLPVTRRNRVDLLVNGPAAFDAMFKEIERAEEYILVQFYIVRADDLGKQLQSRLLDRARKGVRVYFLYDAIGSLGLDGDYIDELRKAGAQVSPFVSTDDVRRAKINFRNHRKLLIVDGKVGFTGGLNVGDEYVGADKKLTPWRDTHVRVEGPAVQFMQIPFAEDWYWMKDAVLSNLNWQPEASDGDMAALSLATGPADPLDTCALFFLAAINSARERIWIATPYFVPDNQIVSALQLAAMRGVDVRILIPDLTDSYMIYLSTFSFLPEIDRHGISVFRFRPGFLHEKVMLIDDDFASVGSANFDNRSFRLNFEQTLAVSDKKFAGEVAAMLEKDFSTSIPTSAKELADSSFPFRLAVRVSRLFAPIQ